MEAGELFTHQAWISNPNVLLASMTGSGQLGLLRSAQENLQPPALNSLASHGGPESTVTKHPIGCLAGRQ